MPSELPYLSSYKNVGTLFEKIASAKAPDAFTTIYLANTLGLKSTTDRPLIALLKTLGFLDPGGKPTAEYLALKNPALAGKAIAGGVRRAYSALFEANENANALDATSLKGLISQVTGADAGVVAKTLGTLQSLLKQADFKDDDGTTEDIADTPAPPDEPPSPTDIKPPNSRGPALRPEFHYNIQVHLPANGTEDTYLHIFNAMRKAFLT